MKHRLFLFILGTLGLLHDTGVIWVTDAACYIDCGDVNGKLQEAIMPGKQKAPGNGGWGVSWADVAEAIDEHEVHHNCTLEFSTYRYKKYKKAEHKIWSVVCHARWNRDTPKEVRGWASCEVGTGSGAATFPGAYLQSLIRSCADLEMSRNSPRKAQAVARLPGFEER